LDLRGHLLQGTHVALHQSIGLMKSEIVVHVQDCEYLFDIHLDQVLLSPVKVEVLTKLTVPDECFRIR
jgi:hypothetical protein